MEIPYRDYFLGPDGNIPGVSGSRAQVQNKRRRSQQPHAFRLNIPSAALCKVGLGRTVASEIETPVPLVNLV
jgi:hypothetical protein